MSKSYLLAHDLGTSGNKASLYGEDGTLLASATHAYDADFYGNGCAEQDADFWWKAVCDATKQVTQSIDTGKIACVSFSGQMMGCLPVDREGNPLRKSIIWADMRAQKQADQLEKEIGREALYAITGTSVAPTYSLEKMMWVKENEPEVYRKTHVFLNAKDYIVYKLTGEFATDYSDASGTNAFEIVNKRWSDDIVRAGNIDMEKLPDAYPSTHMVGKVSRRAAQSCGLAEGTPVVLGGGDGPCATVGAGAVDCKDMYNYFGSSAWIAVAGDAPYLDSKQRTFTLAHLEDGLYMSVGAMQSAGGSYEWMKKNLCASEISESESCGKNVYTIMNEAAEKSVPGANGVLFLPYLLGERCPYWNPEAKGALIGLKMNHTHEDIVRAVFEGALYNLRIILDIFRGEGFCPEQLTLIGAAIKSDFICKLIADIYEVDVMRPQVLEEATSLGAAIAGGVGVGVFEDFSVTKKIVRAKDIIKPDAGTKAFYNKQYALFKKSYDALESLFPEF